MPGDVDRFECVFQLHSGGRHWHSSAGEVDCVASAVGTPVPFVAARFGPSAWYARGPSLSALLRNSITQVGHCLSSVGMMLPS